MFLLVTTWHIGGSQNWCVDVVLNFSTSNFLFFLGIRFETHHSSYSTVCDCDPGFTGQTCENSACSTNPCQNGGKCLIAWGGYKCVCPGGYFGDTCEHDPCKIVVQNGGTKTIEDFHCGGNKGSSDFRVTRTAHDQMDLIFIFQDLQMFSRSTQPAMEQFITTYPMQVVNAVSKSMVILVMQYEYVNALMG